MTKVTIACSHTGEQVEIEPKLNGEAALPCGWKKLGESVYSPDAMKDLYSVRCATFEVWSVEPDDGEGTDKAWKRFREALNLSWRATTGFANWAMSMLRSADNEPLASKDGKVKMPKFPDISKALYTVGREKWPLLDSQSLGSIRQKVLAKYNDCRWDVRVTHKVSLPTFRYPTPLPIPSKDVDLEYDVDTNQPWVSLRVSGKRFRLRLSRGESWRRQLADLKAILAGTSKQCEAVLRDGRDGKVMLGLVGYHPKKLSQREKTMHVKTNKDKLFTVVIEGRDFTWDLNEEQIKSIVIGHDRRMHRLAQDQKFERRIGRDVLAPTRERLSKKYHNRLTDFCHKASAMLVEFAVRQKVATIIYDDTCDRFLEEFQWFKLKTMVQHKAAARGIAVEVKEKEED